MAKTTKADDEENLTIDVINSPQATATAIKKLITRNSSPCKAFGLDCEWNVTHGKGNPRPDILQLATIDGYCVIFRLHKMQTVPPDLKDFLECPKYTKVGVAVIEDVLKLEQHFGVATQGVVDVRHLADQEDIDPRGLSTLSLSVLREPCKKHHWRFHEDWTGNLTPTQLRYAAIDAVYGVRIFATLNHRRLCRFWDREWRTWSDDDYNSHTTFLWHQYFNKPFNYSTCKFVIKSLVDDIIRLSDLRTKESEINANIIDKPIIG